MSGDVGDKFRPFFGNSFRSTIQTVGNYGEIYQRNLGAIVPRGGLNTLNSGKTGLMYAFPFGGAIVHEKLPIVGDVEGLLKKVNGRGHLNCGLIEEDIWSGKS